jgi:putative pyoverdin transport system ATP-binding/permease protein
MRLLSSVKNTLTIYLIKRKAKVNNEVLSTIELSQGQRKRLALVTAYLEDRSIYLYV